MVLPHPARPVVVLGFAQPAACAHLAEGPAACLWSMHEGGREGVQRNSLPVGGTTYKSMNHGTQRGCREVVIAGCLVWKGSSTSSSLLLHYAVASLPFLGEPEILIRRVQEQGQTRQAVSCMPRWLPALLPAHPPALRLKPLHLCVPSSSGAKALQPPLPPSPTRLGHVGGRGGCGALVPAAFQLGAH